MKKFSLCQKFSLMPKTELNYNHILYDTNIDYKSYFQLMNCQDCSETPIQISATRGTITSPNFPNDYPNNVNCRWAITIPEPSTVGLHSQL